MVFRKMAIFVISAILAKTPFLGFRCDFPWGQRGFLTPLFWVFQGFGPLFDRFFQKCVIFLCKNIPRRITFFPVLNQFFRIFVHFWKTPKKLFGDPPKIRFFQVRPKSLKMTKMAKIAQERRIDTHTSQNHPIPSEPPKKGPKMGSFWYPQKPENA